MKIKSSRTLGSKWTKTQVLLMNKELSRFVPETRIYTRDALLSMLKKHKMVYVKPVNGSFGLGVIRVDQINHNKYRYQAGTVTRSFVNFNDFFVSLNKNKFKKSYLIQQGIHLLTYNKRIFDTRIMVQQGPLKKWESTGYIGRVAHPNKIVTNFHNSGKPLPLELLLGSYLKDEKKKSYILKLKQLGLQIATQYQKNRLGFKEIGVDIGIDKQFVPWILEVNTAPDPFIFNQLKDKRMFHKVLHYARANGRFVKAK
ncbi:YheC/YheD family protein [Paenibacillus sp. SYP-B3998]|uniref:YheC/YheD family protein n=1 Tax=Paenibacillus sp. SYP-B3998 TaxID=2678564 RepID=A0A6G3ZWT2_9BACL|nr:YheC/YheD family protein [Paenibacillus sp. SYP-B3998]NEW06673.1 YheC/YheD family protein [Paenibacillus sp. SYP-B3998]